MPFCLKCRFEYREGFTHCPDCECELVASLPVQVKEEEDSGQEFVWLANVEDGPLGEGAIAMLRAYEIPYRTCYSDQGLVAELYMGKSFAGIDVYVPEQRLKEARELLEQATFDMSEAMKSSYILMTDTERYGDDIEEILDRYWAETLVPIRECFDSAGQTILLFGQDMVFALFRLCDDGRLGVFVHSEHEEQEVFDAVFAEAEELARSKGIARLWCELPREETDLIGQYMLHGFLGYDRGDHADCRGQETEMLCFERILQDTTES